MRLIDLLDRDRIAVPLEVSNLEDAVDVLAAMMTQTGIVRDEERLRGLVATALPREIVTVGQAFLLHLRLDAVRQLAAAIGVAPKPIRRHPESEQHASIVLLLVAPSREASAHLRALSALARAMSRREVVDAILAASDPDELLGAAPLQELEVPGHLSVRDVMVHRRLSVRPDTTLGEASRVMVEHHVDALPVVSDESEVLGLVTHHELLKYLLPAYVKRESTGEFRRGLGRAGVSGDPHALPVRDVMDRSVLCVSEEQSLAEVANMMVTRDVERLPVVREGQLVGFLTRGDIVRRLFGR
jgi:CBS domain-containing protein